MAQSLAASLSEVEVRREFFEAFAQSAAKEGKLHFASFLNGRGHRVIDRMTETSAYNAGEIGRAIASVRDLEVYVPVRAHRERWTITDIPLVVLALNEDEAPEAIGPDGTRTLLSRQFPPSHPVIVLAANETDLSAQRAANERGKPERECAVSTFDVLEKAIQKCGTRRANEILANPATEPGLLGMFLREVDFAVDPCGRECWFWGEPELEIHVFGVKNSIPMTTAPQYIQCIGHHPGSGNNPGDKSEAYHYNQDGNHWNGQTKVLSKAQWEALNDTVLKFFMWEDDTSACRVSSQWSENWELGSGLGLAFAGVAIKCIKRPDPDWTRVCASSDILGSFFLSAVSFAYVIAELSDGGDDPVGAVVARNAVPAFQFAGSADHNMLIVADSGRRLMGTLSLMWLHDGVTAGAVAAVKMSAPATLVPVGASIQYSAWGVDSHGLVTPTSSSWGTSNASVASISSSGVITANAVGTTTITATNSGHSTTRTLQVAAIGEPVGIRILPNPINISYGNVVNLSAYLYDANNFEVPIQQTYTWASGNTNACFVSLYGNVSTYDTQNLTTWITASAEELTSTPVTCTSNEGYGGQWSVRPPARATPGRPATAKPRGFPPR